MTLPCGTPALSETTTNGLTIHPKIAITCNLSAITDSQRPIFAAALIAFRGNGKVVHPALDISPPAPQSPVCQAKATKRLLVSSKILVSSVEDRLDQLLAGGFVWIFTHASSEKHPIVGDMAGYGVYSECGMTISAHVPIDQRQTNDTVELLSSIKALQATDATLLAICTGSSYVHLGATGVVRRRRVGGWVESAGMRVSNTTSWEELGRWCIIVHCCCLPCPTGT